VSEIHPDTARLDWLATQKSTLFYRWVMGGEAFDLMLDHPVDCDPGRLRVQAQSIREAIDTAMKYFPTPPPDDRP